MSAELAVDLRHTADRVLERGLIERENRSVLGIGVDSAVALLVYAAGMAVLYTMTT